MSTHSTNYRKGLLAETIATAFLLLKGYTILERRRRGGGSLAEIDIIARRGDTIAFIEVKARRTIADGLLAITPHQQQRLRAAAEQYIAKFAPNLNGRFDVIVVCNFLPHHFQNMF
ncbi:MAG: YraN family protein [Rickettsiales bacterium]|jgi:putative endonuclease|nr:YraN family protein [Rickettsiales bacterium]